VTQPYKIHLIPPKWVHLPRVNPNSNPGWQSCNRPHYTHLRLSCWHRDVHSRSFSRSKRGQTRQPISCL